jgi:predicted dehydrogenase
MPSADRHEDRGRPLADRHGVGHGHRGHSRRSEIDALVLALPPQYHADMAIAVLEAGKHVLVEKPIALSVADARRVVDAASRARPGGHDRPCAALPSRFRGARGLIGPESSAPCATFIPTASGLGKFHAENDALWDIAPHDLSLILALTGEKPVSVRGVGSAMLNRLSDFAHLHLQFPAACAATSLPPGSIPTASASSP